MDGDDVAQDRRDDTHRLARFLLHRDLEQTATNLRQLLSNAAAGSSAEQQAKSALQVVARAGRTLDEMIGRATPERTRQPTRIAPLIEQVAATHDPEGRRIVRTIPSIVTNLDALRFERTVDQLLAHVLDHAAPATTVELTVAPTTVGIRLSVTHDGRLSSRRAADASSAGQLTSWEAVVALVASQHGQLRTNDRKIEIELSRRDPSPQDLTS
jgi:signal transduction histidine kinase